jgi:ATP-dependent helicase YprA (DUF1998 family)
MTAFTKRDSPELELGVSQAVEQIHGRLRRYLEAQYHIRNSSLIEERLRLLNEAGAIAQKPYIEVTPAYEVAAGYDQLRLPDAMRALLVELAAWKPGVGVYPPYVHQAEALQAFFRDADDGDDLVIATGTGSGKTETFLYALLGMLAVEATSRPASFQMPGVRALLLYPMNALVSDQTARLRRMLGNERLAADLRVRWNRHVTFGMYTSRTPYPGIRTGSRDQRHVAPILRYYDALESSTDPSDQSLVRELRDRGRWPAKNVPAFFGRDLEEKKPYAKGKRAEEKKEYIQRHWKQRLITQPGDRELLTRDEMQRRAPDLLVTNYSMLEYTLLRPLERSIYRQTRDWLESDARNKLVLILDEAHMYRGVGGAEVGLLIRRLQSRLGIGRDRLRCILTSASLSSAEKDNPTVQAFARGLCGGRPDRSFAVVTGTRERRPPPAPGDESEARGFASVSAGALAAAKVDRNSAQETVERVAHELRWSQPPGLEATEQALRQYVGEKLRGVGPLENLLAQCSANGTEFLELTKKLFPASPALAEQATNGLLALGTFARRSEPGREDQPLVPTRVHIMFRGLPAIFACIDPTCPGRRYQGVLPSLVGRVVTEPATSCAWCGARVFEVFTHRDCGTAFLRVFAAEPRAPFYWHERGGRLTTVERPLHEVHVLIEPPHPRAKDLEPIWIDLRTGRVSRSEPERQEESRLCFRPSADGQSDLTTFERCPVCLRRTRPGGGKAGLKIMDLATKGEQPFANLIREQFVSQVLTRARSEQHPNGGRKALLFSDGRQKAARLARDLPREVERDSFRETIVVAASELEKLKIEATLDKTLYAAFVAVCARHHLHFFDRVDQERLIEDIARFQKDYTGDLEMALAETWAPDPPVRYRQALLRQVSDPYYSLVAACAAIVEPRANKMKLLERRQPAIPSVTLRQVTCVFINEMLRRNAFDQALRLDARQDVGFFDPLKESGLKRFFDDVSRRGTLDESAAASLRGDLFDVLTVLGPDESGRLLNPEILKLRIAVNDTWYQCRLCAHLQHSPLFAGCGNCGEQTLEERPPNHEYMEARKDYFRKPIRDALAGEPPVHLTAEEHTAQLSQRDTGDVYATTEEFELRFQDVPLGPKKPPVDILSCTTTMEVGIDIGSLTAVGMRTMPPQRENYQQRAGRAGRRGSAVSTVLTYAQGGAHDAHYFERPWEIISGKPRDPKIKSDNRRLAVRHIHSFLLQTFFHGQLDDLAPKEYERVRRSRPNLMSAFGDAVDFFEGDSDFSLVAFDRWIDREVLQPDSALVSEMIAWLPPELAMGAEDARTELDAFVRDTTLQLLSKIRSLRPGLDEVAVSDDELQPEGDDKEDEEDEEEGANEDEHRTLLDLLFDAGVLPSYAFPTDLCSFVIQEEDNYDVAIKERPQLAKAQALSEYAPGRLLVVNKETYRVGGVFVGGVPTANPATVLFQVPLTRYVGCDACNFVRLEAGEVATTDKTPCPICDAPLRVREILDPPGFSPEEGRPVREGDRDQEITYASSAQLPELVERDKFDWRTTIGTHLRHAYSADIQLVVANKGNDKENEGFVVCESCGAAWLFGDEPEDGRHRRPFLLPKSVRIKERPPVICTGPLNRGLFLAHQFRTDILLLRIALRHPIDGDPSKPWLRDGLSTLAEALALGASLHLDIDPGDLSAGYRFTVDVDRQRCAEIYLFDTASGGAGYAADAGEELELVLERTRNLLLGCPAACERSCTRCLRHYGNRFLHPHMDRYLASQLLEFAMTGRVPAIDDISRQSSLLAPLAQWLRLEGWDIGSDRDAALFARPPQGSTHLAIGVHPALIHQDEARQLHPLSARADGVVLPDYVVSRDLPAAYRILSAPRTRAAIRLNLFPVRAWGATSNSDAVINLDIDPMPDCFALRVPFDAFARLGIERGEWLVVRPFDGGQVGSERVLVRRRGGTFGATSSEWAVGHLKRLTDQHADRGQISYARPEREFRPERVAWSELEIVGIVMGTGTAPPQN